MNSKFLILSKILPVLLLLLVSCTGNKQSSSDGGFTIIPVELPDDIVEVRGTVGSGTTMNVLELITTEGDTLHIISSDQTAMGGQVVGSSMDVIYSVIEGECVAQVAINTSALMHLWSQQGADGHRQSLELNTGGRAVTYDMKLKYEKWSIKDGELLLQSPRPIADEGPVHIDTFNIMMLTEDSLVLMSTGYPVETKFYRDN